MKTCPYFQGLTEHFETLVQLVAYKRSVAANIIHKMNSLQS